MLTKSSKSKASTSSGSGSVFTGSESSCFAKTGTVFFLGTFRPAQEPASALCKCTSILVPNMEADDSETDITPLSSRSRLKQPPRSGKYTLIFSRTGLTSTVEAEGSYFLA